VALIKTDYEKGRLQPTPAGHPKLATPRANHFLLVPSPFLPLYQTSSLAAIRSAAITCIASVDLPTGSDAVATYVLAADNASRVHVLRQGKVVQVNSRIMVTPSLSAWWWWPLANTSLL
jgi:hypothetical protein